nr:nitrite reductase small subunit NirD [Sorangium cellulosum]
MTMAMNGLPPGAPRSENVTHSWIDVCGLEDIIPNTGVCALVGKRQIAVVRVGEGEELYAVSNFDPFSKAFVISRGIVGDKGGVPKIASPIYKQNFDLRTGQCLDDPEVRLPVYAVRVRGGRVEVLVPPQAGAQAS